MLKAASRLPAKAAAPAPPAPALYQFDGRPSGGSGRMSRKLRCGEADIDSLRLMLTRPQTLARLAWPGLFFTTRSLTV